MKPMNRGANLPNFEDLRAGILVRSLLEIGGIDLVGIDSYGPNIAHVAF
jgi:hypothetical protein